MVCGTTSDAGKSALVTGLCRLLSRRGVRVAPFKAQNMALNSYVTPSGHEIGRAQGTQALAAGVIPEVAMNPVLLKPTGERTSQVVVNGRPWQTMTAAEYHRAKPRLRRLVADSLADLRRRFDVVLCEGAGSPTEINLLTHDIVNLGVARDAGLPAVVVGDIDRGGVFAALYGTVALLPDDLRGCVRGFVVNKFRGDPVLLGDAFAHLQAASGVPTLGVLPLLEDVALDAEDSLALAGPRPRPVAAPHPGTDVLDVAVVRFPCLSNVTDMDALSLEPGVSVRLVEHGSALGDPDLVVLPGTKATVADLAWLRQVGLGAAITRQAGRSTVLGICGGYQMLGRRIHDTVESGAGDIQGLGLLAVTTTFEGDKVLAQRTGHTASDADASVPVPVGGYQIHHGRVGRDREVRPWFRLAGEHGPEEEGAINADGSVRGTTLHGLLEHDEFRRRLLVTVAGRRQKRFIPVTYSFTEARMTQYDRLADAIDQHLDLEALAALIAGAGPLPAGPSDIPMESSA